MVYRLNSFEFRVVHKRILNRVDVENLLYDFTVVGI